MHTLPSTTFTHSFFEKIIWIDRISLLDIWVKKKETKKALESILQIIWRVIAICTPLQFDSKKPLALPGRPSAMIVCRGQIKQRRCVRKKERLVDVR